MRGCRWTSTATARTSSGIDSRGREFEIVLAADDHEEDLWHAIHALQTRYRKNW